MDARLRVRSAVPMPTYPLAGAFYALLRAPHLSVDELHRSLGGTRIDVEDVLDALG